MSKPSCEEEIVDISVLQLENGFTINTSFLSKIVKKSNRVTMNIVIDRNENISNEQTIALRLPDGFSPRNNFIASCGLATAGGWIIDGVGFCMVHMVGGGGVSIRNNTGKEYKTAVINLTYDV